MRRTPVSYVVLILSAIMAFFYGVFTGLNPDTGQCDNRGRQFPSSWLLFNPWRLR